MKRRTRSGFTLLEMVVALSIFSIVVSAISGVLVATQREFTRQREAMKGEDTIRSVETVVVRLLRNGRADPTSAGTAVARIDFNPQSHGTWDNVRVRSDFNQPDGAFDGVLEDVLITKVADTLFVRWKDGGETQRLAHPVKTFRLDGYTLEGTAITNAAQSDLVRKVKLTVEVPKPSSATEVVRRERWVFLRN